MWIFTPIGFYSAVKSTRPAHEGDIEVRARVKRDLVNLIEAAGSQFENWIDLEIVETPTHDYPYRIIVPRYQMSAVVARLVEDIDYTNFKSEVTRTQGFERHDTYLKVWTVLNNAMRKFRPGWPKPSGQGKLDMHSGLPPLRPAYRPSLAQLIGTWHRARFSWGPPHNAEKGDWIQEVRLRGESFRRAWMLRRAFKADVEKHGLTEGPGWYLIDPDGKSTKMQDIGIDNIKLEARVMIFDHYRKTTDEH